MVEYFFYLESAKNAPYEGEKGREISFEFAECPIRNQEELSRVRYLFFNNADL